MDREALIILALIAGSIFLVWLLLSLANGAPVKISLSFLVKSNKTGVTKAEIIEEMCKVQGLVKVTRLARDRGLSQAEINILKYKANPFHSGAFRVIETADQKGINKWLMHPMVNHPWPDSFVMSMAAQTPMPVKMMEKMLRKLLLGNYEESFKEAEARIVTRRQEH